MARKVRTTFIWVIFFLIVFLASVNHLLFSDSVSDNLRPATSLPTTVLAYQAIHEPFTTPSRLTPTTISSSHPAPTSSPSSSSISTVSILLPAWEVLVIVSPESPVQSNPDEYNCLFSNNDVSPAKPTGELSFPNRTLFKCDLPPRARRRLPLRQPVLIKTNQDLPDRKSPAPELIKYKYVVYDSLTTEDDVVLFVKGLNNRQLSDRQPKEFNCVFYGDDVINVVRTAVTSSTQEVFRCQRPDLTAVSPSVGDEEGGKLIKVSLEISDVRHVVPSLAYYTAPRKIANVDEKVELCACTMVYNVAKFLKEWVTYHAKIGIDRFILYDNGSDDDLEAVVAELVEQGYDLKTLFWFWPKTQEAGFSHCAMYAKDTCTWMAYIDVDEFIYSPSWSKSLSPPNKSLLKSLLSPVLKYPNEEISSSSLSLSLPSSKRIIGQFMIGCYEFGPSNQKSHPTQGVMRGYNCRRKMENRHKSIVLVDSIDHSLLNVIHHFRLKEGYMTRKLNLQEMVVNHYKFQAWPEFKAKFRRRVSAYVVDWTQTTNLNSNDRTPGLGYVAVEPQGWPQKFCQVYDNGLKELTQRWFRIESPSGYLMV